MQDRCVIGRNFGLAGRAGVRGALYDASVVDKCAYAGGTGGGTGACCSRKVREGWT